MSHKISYSYIFDDEMERVCKCFTNYYLFTEVTFSGFVTNAKKIKGDNLEEIGTIIELKFKNYYDFRIEIINVKKGPLYQNIVHKLVVVITVFLDNCLNNISIMPYPNHTASNVQKAPELCFLFFDL